MIPNGVDVERFHPTQPPFERVARPDHVNLLFVGRLDPRKGLQFLLDGDARDRARARTAARRLLVVGDLVPAPQVRGRRSPPRCARHVHFLGHVPSHDLPRWYATGDLFVSPASGNESFGIVLLEAMAAGRAVVASDIPGYRSVVHA